MKLPKLKLPKPKLPKPKLFLKVLVLTYITTFLIIMVADLFLMSGATLWNKMHDSYLGALSIMLIVGLFFVPGYAVYSGIRTKFSGK